MSVITKVIRFLQGEILHLYFDNFWSIILPGSIVPAVSGIHGFFEKQQNLCIRQHEIWSSYRMQLNFLRYQKAIDYMLQTFLHEVTAVGNQKDGADILMHLFHTNQE